MVRNKYFHDPNVVVQKLFSFGTGKLDNVMYINDAE